MVAAALGENKRAKIVGTRTFGKASIQAVVPMPGGGAVKLTVATYLTPERPRPPRPGHPARRAPCRRGCSSGRSPWPGTCLCDRRAGRAAAGRMHGRAPGALPGRVSRSSTTASSCPRPALGTGGAGGRARGGRGRGRQRPGRRASRLARSRGQRAAGAAPAARPRAPSGPRRRSGRPGARPRKPDDEGRRDDLLELAAITIDPPTARDFDDAISVEPDGDGVRAWVHIADVASYVRPGSALDAEAARRTCSVYVPGSVEPMLPLDLSAEPAACAPGEVRRVVSARGARRRRRQARCAARAPGADPQPRAPEPTTRRTRCLRGSAHHPQGDLLARADALARDLRARRHARGAFSLRVARALVRAGRRSRGRRPLGRGAASARARRGADAARERGRRRAARARTPPGALPRARPSDSTRRCWRWPIA